MALISARHKGIFSSLQGELKIREASSDDLDEVLCEHVNQLPTLHDRLRQVARQKGELLVADLGGRLVGHVFLWLVPAEERNLRRRLPDVPLIMNLWVDWSYRHHGIGTRLMEEAHARLRQRGHRRVALGVDPANKAAVKLYLGMYYDPWPYEDIKTERVEYIDGRRVRIPETCAIYVKEL